MRGLDNWAQIWVHVDPYESNIIILPTYSYEDGDDTRIQIGRRIRYVMARLARDEYIVRRQNSSRAFGDNPSVFTVVRLENLV